MLTGIMHFVSCKVFRSLKKNEEQKYGELAQRVKESFARKFWMEEKHCLKDVISETKADTQIRCNQIWAVSMPFTMLDEEKERPDCRYSV